MKPFIALPVFVAFVGIVVMSHAAEGEKNAIASLKPLFIETHLGEGGKPRALIVAGTPYAKLAERLQADIEEATGIKLPVFDDVKALRNLDKKRHLIVLGHYGNNKVIEHFYYRWYLVVDGVQPGKGGYVLQTVHNPDALGINLIVVGGSDDAGVAKAAERLTARIKEHGATLPRLFEMELGSGKEIVEKRGREVLDPKRTWPTGHPLEEQQAIAEAGMLYVYTGDEAYAQAFKEKLVEGLRERENVGNGDDFYMVMITWDLVEEAPVFSDEERLWITNALWKLLERHGPEEYTTYCFSRKDKIWPRKNHGVRYACSVYFAARYFHQYYQMPEMNRWIANVRQYYECQMKSWMPAEGTDSMAHISLMTTLEYVLAEDERGFLSREVLGRIADKWLMKTPGKAYGGGGRTGPLLFWCLAAHVLDAPEYLLPIYRWDPSMNAVRLPWQVGWCVGRSFYDGTIPEEREISQDWLASMPVSPLYFDHTQWAEGAKNIPRKDAFDFLVFKDPKGENGQYVVINGHNTGSYSTDGANGITAYLNGARWLSGGWHIATARKHTTMCISRNGEGKPLPAFAKMERATSGEGWGISRTALMDYNGADWHRNVINAPGEWFLVVDEVHAREPGDYVIENRWVCFGGGGFDGEDYVTMRSDSDRAFRLAGSGWENQYVVPMQMGAFLKESRRALVQRAEGLTPQSPTWYASIVARRWAGRMEEGDTRVFAHLFHTYPWQEAPAFRLERVADDRYVVVGKERKWLVHAGEDAKWIVEEASEVPLAPVVKRATAEVATDMEPTWQEEQTARILSAATLTVAEGTRYAIGLADGRIRVFDGGGAPVGEAKMKGMVFALSAMDLDGDGSDELVAGSDVGGVVAFEADGAERWRWTPPAWKQPPWLKLSSRAIRSIVTGIQPADVDGDGKAEVLVSGTYWYVLDREGKPIFVYDKEWGGQSWLGITPEMYYLLAPGDMTGDGKAELVIGSEAYNNQLGYYDYADQANWSLDLSCGINALAAADFDGDGKAEIIAGTEMGQVQAIDDKKGRRFVTDVKEGVTALAIKGRKEIWVGTVNGRLFVLDAKGEIRRRGALRGMVNHIAIGGEGSVLATTTGGTMAAYEP